MLKFKFKNRFKIAIIIIALVVVFSIGGGLGYAVFLGSGSSGSINLEKGLVGYWSLDGDAKDRTPNRNNGTVTGATLTTDRKSQSNKAYTIGSSKTITFGNSASHDLSTTDFTITLWVKGSPSTGRDIVGKWDASGGYSISQAGNQFIFFYKDTGRYRYFATDQSNVWTFLTAVRSGSSTHNVYTNGVLDNGNTTGSDIADIGNSATNLTLSGGGRYGAQLVSDHSVDDVRIYKRALSQVEITGLYNSYNPSIQESTLQKGLIGYWSLDGDAKDRTPNKNHGTVTGATLTTDRKAQSNKAYSFNGVDQIISVSNPSSILLPTGVITISAWVKVGATANVNTITNRGNSANVQSWAWFAYDGGGANKLQIRNANGGTNSISNAISIEDSTWHHVVVKASTGTYPQFFLDGVDVSQTSPPTLGNTNTYTETNAVLTTYPFDIGARNHSGGVLEELTGSIGDVRIYNRALSATEVTSLYNSYNPSIQESTLQKGLIGYWSFDGDAKDRTPNRNHGTVTAATLTTDRQIQSNKAYDFDGATAIIDAGNPTLFDVSSVLTYSAWIKAETLVGVSRIFEKGISSDFTFIMSPDSTGGDNMRCIVTTSVTSYTITDPSVFSTGTWAHFACVFDASANTLSLYRNGVSVTTPTTTSGNLVTNTRNLIIGGKVGGAGAFFDGVIDDVRVYNRALSATEILALYNSY